MHCDAGRRFWVENIEFIAMLLIDKLNQFDGKNLDSLAEIATANEPTESAVNDLLDIVKVGASRQQIAATWVLKHWIESGLQLTERQVTTWLDSLPDLAHWESVLHTLQVLPEVLIPAASAVPLYHFLKCHLVDDNKFIRAWTYNGLDVLAQHYPEYRGETEQLLHLALRDEPASVRARVRQIFRAREK